MPPSSLMLPSNRIPLLKVIEKKECPKILLEESDFVFFPYYFYKNTKLCTIMDAEDYTNYFDSSFSFLPEHEQLLEISSFSTPTNSSLADYAKL